MSLFPYKLQKPQLLSNSNIPSGLLKPTQKIQILTTSENQPIMVQQPNYNTSKTVDTSQKPTNTTNNH